MNQAQQSEVQTIARLHIHEYFDHYLTDIFPAQMKEMFHSHNHDLEAHQGQLKKLVRIKWMVAGVIATAGMLGAGIGFIATYIGPVIKHLLP